MSDSQELRRTPPATHDHDRRFNAILGWSIAWSAISASIFAGSILGLYSGQLSWQGALPSMAGSVAVMAVINFVGYKQKAPELKNPGPVMLFIALLTWCFVAWQTWTWFHPSTQAVQGYTEAQLDDAKAKAKQDQLDQDKKDAAQQSADAVTKATAPLRAQIAQLQSDTPVSIDKLPTSLTLSFKGGNVEQIGNAPNVVWTKMFGWQGPSILFGAGGNPSWVIVIVFKKPIAYKTFCFDGHNSGISTPAAEKNPYYAIITFDPGPLDGLVDLRAANECAK